jgi:formylglycine-generating enzyme required for sulfatase activity
MIAEPEIITVTAGPVVLGVPEFPSESTLPHRWPKKQVDVPAFGIARCAVTVGEYLAFADKTGYAVAAELRSDARFQDPRAPAAYVSWIDAIRYTQWLARETGRPYRLVRDAEYEKAARGGLIGKRYPWGDEPPDDRADFGRPEGIPRPVGSFAPNEYGLHDMVGSMWSWCEECYDQVVDDDKARMCYEDTLIKDVRLNPICRGGSFKTADATVLYCAYRHEDPVDGQFDCIGFRVALSVD